MPIAMKGVLTTDGQQPTSSVIALTDYVLPALFWHEYSLWVLTHIETHRDTMD
jgi:hypothetical protein